jgi:hypothetical protein
LAHVPIGQWVQESSANESSSEIVLALVVVLVDETEDEDDWVHASSV